MSLEFYFCMVKSKNTEKISDSKRSGYILSTITLIHEISKCLTEYSVYLEGGKGLYKDILFYFSGITFIFFCVYYSYYFISTLFSTIWKEKLS